MKEVVWVFGNGAAGKATFINYLISPDSAAVRKKLGWDHAKVAACKESLKWLGMVSDDSVITKRAQIPSIVTQLAQISDVILIKGQDVDLVNHLPEQVADLLHGATHKIIYILTDLDELMERRSRKPWWNGTDTADEVTRLCSEQLAMLAPLQKHMDFMVIDGSRGKGYSFTALPLQ